MASIPLPALHVNPPTDQGEGIQRMVQMMTMLRQQKAQDALLPGQVQQQQQTLASGAMENQQKQIQLKDQQAMTNAMQEWDGKDINTLPGLMLKHGASAQTVMSTKTGIIKQQQDMENLSKDQLANQATVNDRLLGHIDAIKGVTDPAQRGSVAQQQAQQIIQAGLHKNLDPQSAQMVQAIAQGQMVPTDDQISSFEKGFTAHNAQIEQAAKAAETREKNAQAGKLELETNPNNPADPNIRKQKYEGILSKVQTGGLSAATPEDLAFARSYENGQRKTTTQSDTLGVTSVNTSGPSGLAAAAGQSKGAPAQSGAAAVSSGKTAQPAAGSGGKTANAKDSLVDMIGNYKLNPMMLSRMMAKHPEVIGAVNSKYPDWDQTTYNAKNKMVTSMASGPEGKTLDAINTAMGHIKNLDDAIDALHNGNVTALNNIGKIYNMNFAGKTPEAAFQLIVHRVGPEIASAYIPGGGGQGERMADEKDFDVNLPPQTLHNNAAITVNMLRSKIGAIENRYKNIVGRDDFDKYLTPEAKASLQKMAPQGGGSAGSGSGGAISVKAPNGKTYTFKDQASADAFKSKLPQ